VRTPFAAMFVSLPEYKFFVPPEIAPPDATYWRTLGISTCAAWFVLSVRSREPDAVLDTFLLAWDSDVADSVRSMGVDVDVEGLMFVAPRMRGRKRGWFSRDVVEIWHATDPSDPDSKCILMVGQDGHEYAGFFMDRARGFVRDRLVARVGHSAMGHKSTTAT